MIRSRLILLAISILALAACGTSPPTNYYRLVPLVDKRAPQGKSPVLGIGPINVAQYLEKPQIITSGEGTRLNLAMFDRWGESLETGVTRVLAINLASLVDTSRVYVYPWRRSEIPDYGLHVNLLQFDVVGNEGRLVLEWRLSRPGKDQVLAQRLEMYRTTTSQEGADHAADILSRLLLQFSKEVADLIRSYPQEPLPGNDVGQQTGE